MKFLNALFDSRRHVILVCLCISCIALFSLLWLSIGTHSLAYDAIRSFDSFIYASVNGHAQTLVAQFMLFFTDLDNWQVVFIMLVALSLGITLFHERKMVPFFLGGLALGGAACIIVKALTQRLRPPAVWYTLPRSGYSFPSGHATISTVFYGFMGYCLAHIAPRHWQKRLIAWLTSATVIMIGVSRMYLGVHWASDVIGGWLLGSAGLIVLVLAFDYAHRSVHHVAYSMPHRALFGLIFIIMLLTGFGVFSYYLTHPLEIRSTSTTIQVQE